MASKITTLGLQEAGETWSGIDTKTLLSMSIDNSATSLDANTTQIGGGVTFEAVAFDGTPTRSNQTFSHVATFPTGSTFNGSTIKRILLHFVAFGSVTTTSASVFGGHDAQTFAKTPDFAVTFTLKYTNTTT